MAATLIATIVRELVDVDRDPHIRGTRTIRITHCAHGGSTPAAGTTCICASSCSPCVHVRGGFPWTLALFLAPALAAQRLYGLYQGERQLAADLSTANETPARANLQFAAALIATLDARDRYTAGHSAAVAIYSRDIAGRMDPATDVQEHAYLCGLVHDIGKIGLSPGLLEKPGALTLDERRQMQEHSAIGERILGHVDEYWKSRPSCASITNESMAWRYPDGLAAKRFLLSHASSLWLTLTTQ